MPNGPDLIVMAIAEGRQAARQTDEFLMGKSHLPGKRAVLPFDASRASMRWHGKGEILAGKNGR